MNQYTTHDERASIASKTSECRQILATLDIDVDCLSDAALRLVLYDAHHRIQAAGRDTTSAEDWLWALKLDNRI